MRVAPFLLALLASPAFAEDYSRGQKLMRDYFQDQVSQIEANCLTHLTTKAAWEKERVERRQQFFDMMGLWPLPPRTDLKAKITGTTQGEGFTVEKLHFQSMPGLYVTANFYLPRANPGRDRVASKLPTILYVCGHGNVVVDGISYGTKVNYQYHPAWFATHGYACLILDTHQLHEIPGIHHGTHHLGMWWWHNRGYTPAGLECWNAMRALDYLETRPEVDAKRIGVTGRSGGGATSWWITAADERIQAAVPVAGICDMRSHLCEGLDKSLKSGVIAGHCDCMYMVNSRRWDFADIVALCAPRPVLLGNTDDDRIFPVPGYRRLAEKARKVYALYGAEEKFQLLETTGPHKDTPELRKGINLWMNRWLKDDVSTKVEDDLPPKLKPQDLKVLAKRPEDSVNETIQELRLPPVVLELPKSPQVAKEWWASKRPELMKALEEDVFRGWPKNPPSLKPVVSADVTHAGVRLRGIDFISETGVELRLFVVVSKEVPKPQTSVLEVIGTEEEWKKLCSNLGPKFADALLATESNLPFDEGTFRGYRQMLQTGVAFAYLCPRGIGPTAWAKPGERDDVQVRRRFPLVGQTLDGQRVWDIRRAIQALRAVEGHAPQTLSGKGQGGALALYAGLFEPEVKVISLNNLPSSHLEGPILMNISRHLEMPQAVALAFPRTIFLQLDSLEVKKSFEWTQRLAKSIGAESKLEIK